MINPLPTAEKSIVYEDENIKVIYKPGISDFILCTFGDLHALANGDRIYAESAIGKLAYAAIGFMAKFPNWFPQDSVIRAVEQISSIVRDYSSVVSYGGSMGGYAAIKYSRLLGASHTIACCPQWSIDPAQCNGHKNGYESYYNPHLINMGIETDDMSGNIVILYDPHHEVDSFHYNNICARYDNTTGMHVPYVGHHVTTVMAGTENLRKMIESARAQDRYRLATLISHVRRKSPRRYENLLKASVIKHPMLSAKIILRADKSTPSALNVLNEAILTLVNKNEFQKILELASLSGDNCSPLQQNFMRAVVISIKEFAGVELKDITTFHNTTLYYNVFTSSLCHAKDKNVLSQIRVLKKLHSLSVNGGEYLVVDCDGDFYFVNYLHNAIYLSEKHSESSIKKESSTNGKCCFISDGKYMCAERDGSIIINRNTVSAWELFEN